MDYSQLSDFEINSLVSAHRWGSVCAVDGVVLHNEKDGEFNPCKNPDDAWLIIADNGINILWDWNENGLHGASANPIWEYEHENVLRAAMVVFLMMQDAKHD
ncbi:DUF2591 family protein [Enterobacter sp. E12]|uniref:phage protein NinX family protein n=1 Tax=Enterobacter sp. E12 TaxID=2769348 RepID=UPI001661143C|nr:phage protein NinX family protein [Enterobacter sp. E12]MBD0815555.1 DUF2591 family protein [Enterobacter sp. E12]